MPAVLVPWRGGDPYRERAWAYIAARYRAEHPDWRLIRCECPPGPWVKALAVNPVVAECPDGPVAVADADVWTDGLAAAVQAIEDGAPWAVPHGGVFRLTEGSTEAVLAGAPFDEKAPLEQRPYKGVEGGGILVASRDVLLAVPLDSRFVQWGQEDDSWGIALRCLFGPPVRVTEPLWHLYHPPQERLTRRWGSMEAKRLRARYVAAREDPEQMMALIEEGR